MKKKFKFHRYISLIMSLTLFLSCFSCSSDDDDDKIVADNIALIPSVKELVINSTLQLEAKILPNDTENKTLTWSSEDESIASVSQTGLVTALKEGTVVISAKTTNNIVGKSTITVVAQPSDAFNVPDKLIGDWFGYKVEMLINDKIYDEEAIKTDIINDVDNDGNPIDKEAVVKSLRSSYAYRLDEKYPYFGMLTKSGDYKLTKGSMTESDDEADLYKLKFTFSDVDMGDDDVSYMKNQLVKYLIDENECMFVLCIIPEQGEYAAMFLRVFCNKQESQGLGMLEPIQTIKTKEILKRL